MFRFPNLDLRNESTRQKRNRLASGLTKSAAAQSRRPSIERLEKRELLAFNAFIDAPSLVDGGDDEFGDSGYLVTEIPNDLGNLERVISVAPSKSSAGDTLIAGWGADEDGGGVLMAQLTYDGTIDHVAFANFPNAGSFSRETLFIGSNETGPDHVLLLGITFGEDYPLTTLARYELFSDGSLDESFGDAGIAMIDTGSYVRITSGIVQSDGGVILAGVHYDNVDPELMLIRLTSSGVLDENFGDAGVMTFSGGPVSDHLNLESAEDGKFFVADEDNLWIRRFNQNGTPDNGFAAGEQATLDLLIDDSAYLTDLLVLPSGKLIATLGAYGDFGWQPLLAQFTDNGTLDSSFGVAGLAEIDLTYDAYPRGYCSVTERETRRYRGLLFWSRRW